MMSLAKGDSVAAALSYFTDHLVQGDSVGMYYSEDKGIEGVWCGKFAERLGLEGKAVTKEDLGHVLDGRYSLVGAGDGSLDRCRRSKMLYFDLCFSPSKSVAVLASLDDQIAADLRSIVDQAWKRFESQVAGVRDARGYDAFGKRVYAKKITGELISAEFVHLTSRMGDPGLHFHRLVANASYDADRDMVLALDAYDMFRYRKEFDYEIQSNIARYFLQKGYTTITGKSGVFEIAEVPAAAIDLFSQRSRQVAKAKAELRLEFPDATDHFIDQKAVKASRPAKVPKTGAQLKEDVLRRLAEAGLTIRKPVPQGESAMSPHNSAFQNTLDQVSSNAFEAMVREVFTAETVVKKTKVVASLLKFGRGLLSKRDVEALIKKDSRLAHIPDESGTGRILFVPHQLIEERLLKVGRKMLTPYRSIVSQATIPTELLLDQSSLHNALVAAWARGEEITKDALIRSRQQFQALYLDVMEGQSSLFFNEGGAGVGKSYFLNILKRDIEHTGRKVYAVAPTGRASRYNLSQDFENPQTIAHLLLNKRLQQELKGNVLVVDEAPLADGKSLADLLELCDRLDCKVILQGDLRQQHAVAAIDGVRLLVEELGLGSHLQRLDVTRRQLKKTDKDIAGAWAAGHVEHAINLMLSNGYLIEGQESEYKTRHVDCLTRLAKDYATSLGQNRPALVVSSTHALGSELTHYIRKERKAMGQIGIYDWAVRSDRQLRNGDRLQEGSEFFPDSPACYRVGMRLSLRARADQHAGGKWDVTAINENVIHLQSGNRLRMLDVSKESMADYNIYEPIELLVTNGDKIRLQEKIVVSKTDWSSYHASNGKRAQDIYENGSIETVLGRLQDGSVIFESGLIMKPDDGRLTQGYVSTSIPIQGPSTKDLFMYENERSLKALANLASLYVAASRQTDSLRWYTDSVPALLEYGPRKANREFAIHARRNALVPKPGQGNPDLGVDISVYRVPSSRVAPSENVSETRLSTGVFKPVDKVLVQQGNSPKSKSSATAEVTKKIIEERNQRSPAPVKRPGPPPMKEKKVKTPKFL